MDDDSMIRVTTSGSTMGALVAEPSTGVIEPGVPGYQEMIERVGGLRPGEFRGIPASADEAYGPSTR
jgi:hypothetical protein